MSDETYQIPDLPQEIGAAYRKAHRAFEAILPRDCNFVPEAELQSAYEVIDQFASLANRAKMTVTAYLGPPISWETDQSEAQFELTVAGIDFARDRNSFSARLPTPSGEGWPGSPFDLAAGIYRREAGWDHRPDQSGMWILMLAPQSCHNTDSGQAYSGHLAGFVILHDRDQDKRYESVAHMWTAQGWRRKGIALSLLQEARDRFNYTAVEEPLTDASTAFFNAHPEFLTS